MKRYKAQALQIASFAFMAPFGRLVMKLFDLQFSILMQWSFYVALIVSLTLVWLGIIIMLKGEEHLR